MKRPKPVPAVQRPRWAELMMENYGHTEAARAFRTAYERRVAEEIYKYTQDLPIAELKKLVESL